MKTIAISVDEIYQKMPPWAPLTEWTLRSFLIQSPNLIAPKTHFVGTEIFRIDALFENEDTIFIVETKLDGDETNLRRAIEQLGEAKDVLTKLNLKKKIEPIVCFIGTTVPNNLPQLKNLEERLSDELEALQRQKDRLEREKIELENEILKLQNTKIMVKNWVIQREKRKGKRQKVTGKCFECKHFSSNWCELLVSPMNPKSGCSQFFEPKLEKLKF